VGRTKEEAHAAARAYLERTFAMYRTWEMQERSMVELQLDFDRSLDDWTINGSPRDCVEAIARGREVGLEKIGLTIYSLPREAAARIEYLQMIAEEVLAPAGARA
jgi:hypothetical protein